VLECEEEHDHTASSHSILEQRALVLECEEEHDHTASSHSILEQREL
jgi:hypothetical protein